MKLLIADPKKRRITIAILITLLVVSVITVVLAAAFLLYKNNNPIEKSSVPATTKEFTASPAGTPSGISSTQHEESAPEAVLGFSEEHKRIMRAAISRMVIYNVNESLEKRRARIAEVVDEKALDQAVASPFAETLKDYPNSEVRVDWDSDVIFRDTKAVDTPNGKVYKVSQQITYRILMPQPSGDPWIYVNTAIWEVDVPVHNPKKVVWVKQPLFEKRKPK